LDSPYAPGASGAVLVAASAHAHFHDAEVFGDYLVVASVADQGTRVFKLPITHDLPEPILVIGSSSGPPGGHSTYLDLATPLLEARLYTLAEDPLPTLWKRNLAIYGLDAGDLPAGASLRAVVPFFHPTGVLAPFASPTPDNVALAPVHNLRGLRRTGFVAMYREGLGLVDLLADESTATSPADETFYKNRTLGSFDTTVRSSGVAVPPPGYPAVSPPWAPYANTGYWTGEVLLPGIAPHGAWDQFLGAWDVAVEQDSGLVYTTLGPNLIPGTQQERVLTAGVFLAKLGHVNRYWDATPFPVGSANAPTTAAPGPIPRLVALHGPPRQGRSFLVGDEQAGRYAQTTAAGVPLWYEYTLLCAPSAPTGSGGNNPATAVPPVLWDPLPGTPGNLVALNVWNPHTAIGSQWIRRQGPAPADNAAAGWFSFPSVGNQGDRWYCQLLVHEYEYTGTPRSPTKTGRVAASRGHWFGVARP
jgi:hypothetical protein